eukprot:NODE_1580_length_806_cov_53.652430_g1531_i0.p1 GENE.NODE_1580_length_806_cov_53.652430_g1531_i0~~NODE_1580_length_806_cov_53.652430_g1531_i0.p1  ORF type:complete len:196 (+),score=25.35 NODE_1580_length_806_cov_53.652430_g1531_i0:186-773(+)
MMRVSVESRNWMTIMEPRKVSTLWNHVLKDMELAAGYVEQLYESDQNRSPPSSEASSKRVGQSSVAMRQNYLQGSTFGDNFLTNIDKLFSDSVDLFGKIEFKANSVLAAIVTLLLKNFTESLRLKTFSKNGYQQVQVDVEFIRIHFWKYCAEKTLNTLLEDIHASVHHRCPNPVAMEPSVIQNLVLKKSEQIPDA